MGRQPVVHEHVSEQAPDRRNPAPRAPAPVEAVGLAALQRTAGNAAVVRMLQLAGHPGGPHQHGPGCGHGARGAAGAEEAPVQRSAVHEVLAASGRPLDGALRAEMETRLGADFSDVRIHDDGAARASAAEVGARAYTSGRHVVIGEGGGDKHTLAHELTHVIQQRQGPVAGTDNGSGLKVSDPSDRFEREAEANATRVMAGPAPDGDRHAAGAHAHDGPARSAPSASEPVSVARLISAEDFKESSKASGMRPGDVKKLDKLLEAYGRKGRDDYGGRTTVLDQIRTTAQNALSGKLPSERRPAVAKVLDEARAEYAIYSRLDGVLEQPPAQAASDLIGLYEELLPLIQAGGPNSDLSILSTTLSDHLQRRVGTLLGAVTKGSAVGATPAEALAGTAAAEALAGLVANDLNALVAMAADPHAPQETREVLAEVTGLSGIVDLGVGMPGTRRIDDRYRMTHAVNQTEGKVERLGSLAHELTHVAAGESYDNTAILLLCRSDLTEGQMRELAQERAGHAGRLKGLLGGTPVTARQRSLIENKLEYITKRGQLGKYVQGFRAALVAENEEKERMLQRLVDQDGGECASLVEYDTVLTQLLVYLHSWNVPADEPFHREVRRLAQIQRAGRLNAMGPAPAVNA